MKLSVCIPTYNRPEHLLNCLNFFVCKIIKILRYVFQIILKKQISKN